MNKKILITACITVGVTFTSAYFYFKNKEEKRKLVETQPLEIVSLRASLEQQGIRLEGACANPTSVNVDLSHKANFDFKQRFNYLCEDIDLAQKLDKNFSDNLDYSYFLECAKTHTANMNQITNDLKNHYPKDYKELNFNKEDILVKYLKHPKSAFLMAQCESKAEALYWKSIISSGKVEDLKFCQKITEECINGITKSEECPVNFKNYNDECTEKLNKLFSK